jgi:hypothetical protein
MEFQYDLSGGSTAIVKKYQVAATNTTIGVPYLKNVDDGTGIVLGTTTGAADFIGVNVDAAGTYVTAQQSDNSDTARLTSIICNPLAVYRARLCGGAANEALSAATITTASADGLSVVTSAFDPNNPDLNEGTVWGYSGANAGKSRKITSTAANDATVIVAFPYDIAVGDQFLYANVHPTRSILGQLGTDLTTLDATAALSGETNAILTVELILNDLAGEGTINSYGLIHFGDHLMLSSAP